MLDLCLLGTGGTLPLPGRRLSALLVRAGSGLVLIDCGEGTQVAVRDRGWGLRRLDAVLLTDTHADHVLGLPGLLLSLAFAERGADEPLTIYGPPTLEPVLRGLRVVAPRLPFPVETVWLEGGEELSVPGGTGLRLTCAPADHDVPCLAYGLHLPRAPRFDADAARSLGVPQPLWGRLQRGEQVTVDGRVVSPDAVRGVPRRGLRVAYVTDTRPRRGIVELVRAGGEGADLLVVEGMYGDDAQRPARWESKHLSYREAAELARDSEARRLWLMHHSPGLADPDAYLDRATAVFPAAELGRDGMTATLRFED